MATRTIGCEGPISQPSGSGERPKRATRQPVSNGVTKQSNGKEMRSSKTATPPASSQVQPLGAAAKAEKSRRWNKHQTNYQAFLAAAERRHIARKELENRNKVWKDENQKAQARLESLEKERQHILQKIEAMEAAKGRYNARYSVRVSGEQDQATRENWDAYFNLETDVLDV